MMDRVWPRTSKALETIATIWAAAKWWVARALKRRAVRSAPPLPVSQQAYGPQTMWFSWMGAAERRRMFSRLTI